MATPYLLSLVGGYLLGSIPFGLIFTKLAGTQDIRAIGSGGIGATNVLRTGRYGLAAATLLADVLKGMVAVLLAAWWFGHDAGLVAGLAAFLGHLFPVWLKFKGGKGIATGLGVLLAVSWQAALAAAVIWIAVAAATRYSSVASLVASAVVPVALVPRHAGRSADLRDPARAHRHHASSQHRPPHERHRKQDRPESRRSARGVKWLLSQTRSGSTGCN
jgi:glycerol-3-phosphate acyltransferase PlsY